MTNAQDESPPALFLHICATYEAMDKVAKDVPDGDQTRRVYQGHITKLVTRQLGLSVPYYTDITQALRAMGCAFQSRRGGGSSTSEWILLKEPDLLSYEDWKRSDTTRRAVSKTSQQAGQIRDHDSRIMALEEGYDALLDLCQDMSTRLKVLEGDSV